MSIARLVLEVVSGPHQGERIEVGAGAVVRVGRTAKADIILQDTFMSGEHFAVECDSQTCLLVDLKSRNGTSLNGKGITTEPIHDGDKIHAGKTDFFVRIEDVVQDSGEMQVARVSALRESESFDGVTDAPEAPEPAPSPAVEQVMGRSGTSQVSSAESQKQPLNAPPPEVKTPEASSSIPRAPNELDLSAAWNTYEAATLEGRLLRILQTQPASLMALVDATHEPRILQYLQNSGEEYRSLYKESMTPTIAPFLVRFHPRSNFLKRMVKEGWGKGWGIYLTCQLPLEQVRNYFREALMISLPDGTELFSRFYDPKFFRTFLETCTAAEAEKFFGPVNSYLMESDRQEVLLQFTKIKDGVEKRGHLLSTLE
ncbi:MAG TPA: DUF4123 domain-containing protein [Pyrinomonadaceae bacterium]